MKRRCVLGVLKTEQGLKIKEEMLKWLSKKYEVIAVEQEAPGELYELPGITMAANLSVQTNEPVLYVHTKGAAMQNNAQPMVRDVWKREFGRDCELYFDKAEKAQTAHIAGAFAPMVSKEKHVCWFNGFVMNTNAAKRILSCLETKLDRMWFEQGLLEEAPVACFGRYEENADDPSQAWKKFLEIYEKSVLQGTRFAVVSIMKHEDRYIKEWVEYYRKLGVNHFYVFNNDDENETGQEQVFNSLNDLAHSDIHLFDCRGRAKLAGMGYQAGIYKWTYDTFGEDYDWMLFLDADEFLNLNGKTLQEWMSENRHTFAYTSVIKFNWMYYGDCGHVKYEDKPVRERFRTPCPADVKYAQAFPEDWYCKPMIRTGLPMRQHIIHSALISSPHACMSATGKPQNPMAGQVVPPDFSNGFIEHYGTKSLEEYMEKRCMDIKNVNNEQEYNTDQRLEWYFNVNERTPRKEEFIKQFRETHVCR